MFPNPRPVFNRQSGAAQTRGGEDDAREKDMQRQYETKLTEMSQEREAARPTQHAKALQEGAHIDEPKEKHSDGIEKLKQEVPKMAQEKKDMQRKFEEVLREAAQERQAS
jgi:hypothetical protein